jgi:hypothetical protein
MPWATQACSVAPYKRKQQQKKKERKKERKEGRRNLRN